MAMAGAPAHWRRYKEIYSLQGSHCNTCGKAYFPARKICPNCRRQGKIEPLPFTGKGKVHTFTVIRSPPEGFEDYIPYVIGLIKLNEGPMVTSQVVDCNPEDVYIGMPVETCFRKLRAQEDGGVIIYGFKFKPADGAIKQPANVDSRL